MESGPLLFLKLALDSLEHPDNVSTVHSAVLLCYLEKYLHMYIFFNFSFDIFLVGSVDAETTDSWGPLCFLSYFLQP